MSSKRKPTRRKFLQNTAAITVVASSVAGQPIFAASDTKKSEAEKLELGVKPETSSPGPVVVETGDNVSLVFYGCGEDKRGNDTGDGSVMVTFQGCRHWRLRKPNDEETPSHSIDVQGLDFCEVYQVKNSDWNPTTGDQSTDGPKEKLDGLNHYIVTFFGFDPELIGGGTHFECLAEDIEAELFPEADFEKLNKLMVARELSSSSTSRRTIQRSKIH